MRRRFGIAGAILIIQSVLVLTHFFLYQTWTFSAPGANALWVKIALGVLSVSFVSASLFAFRYTNPVLRAFYRAAAVWLGLLSFLFVAALTSWIVFAVARIAGFNINFHQLAKILFAAATVIG